MQDSTDRDRELYDMRCLREEYENAIVSETDADECWRLRRLMHELHRYILELERDLQTQE